MPAGPWDKRGQGDMVGEDRPGGCSKAVSAVLASDSSRDLEELI